jgi:hypothetical protein
MDAEMCDECKASLSTFYDWDQTSTIIALLEDRCPSPPSSKKPLPNIPPRSLFGGGLEGLAQWLDTGQQTPPPLLSQVLQQDV